MTIQPGSQLGPYRVEELIGRGAMGTVYRAWHAGLARPAAVKVLQALAPDPDAAARFGREGQAIAQLRHPNILQVFDVGEDNGIPYLVVEYLPGGSLADMLADPGRRPDAAGAVELLRGLAAGLDHAHAQGVVHRDVKPANVMLGPGPTPVLADFGLAKLVESSTATASGATTGTPAYMAPEQITGGPIGPAADRYALAALAYEMLTGQVPFTSRVVMELLYAHVHRAPPAATSVRPALPGAVDAVLARGLAKEPHERFASSAALVDALARSLGGSPVEAPVLTPAPPPPTAPGVAVTQPLAAPTRRRRRPARLLVAAIAALALLGGGTLALAGRGQAAELAVSSSTVQAGDTVVVTIAHAPPGQPGEIRLQGDSRTLGDFATDSSGAGSATVLVPRATSPGDHRLEACWAGSCHGGATIHVLPPTPTPTPVPAPTATARPTFLPQVSLSTVTPRLGVAFQVTGTGFDPSRQASIGIQQGTRYSQLAPSSAVGRDGRWALTITITSTLAGTGNAVIYSCMVVPDQAPAINQSCARAQIVVLR